jgi:hypothetical protein
MRTIIATFDRCMLQLLPLFPEHSRVLGQSWCETQHTLPWCNLQGRVPSFPLAENIIRGIREHAYQSGDPLF